MKVEVPLGDVVDKVIILRIKLEKIGTAHVQRELDSLVESWESEGLPPMSTLPQYGPLGAVNARLWDVEDALRSLESEDRFDSHFVALARSVYGLNDERAALKRAINLALGSKLVEEKSYAATSNTNR